MADIERAEYSAQVARNTEMTANIMLNLAKEAAEQKKLVDGIQIGLSRADEFMKVLALATGNILDAAKKNLTRATLLDDIGIHVRAKKVAKCVAFILQHGHPTYQKFIRDHISAEFRKAIFSSGRNVKEGSRKYPVLLINNATGGEGSVAGFVFKDCDAFKAWCMMRIYDATYADPNDKYKGYVSSKGFSNLLLGVPVEHVANAELAVDTMSLEDMARRHNVSSSSTANAGNGTPSSQTQAAARTPTTSSTVTPGTF